MNDRLSSGTRRSGGLKGCLIVLVALALIGGMAVAVIAWRFYREFQSDPRVQSIVMALKADTRARAVFGGPFVVMEVERHTFPMASGGRDAEDYRLTVVSRTGKSIVDARLEPVGMGTKIVELKLSGPNGETVWLKSHRRSPFLR